MAWHSIRSDTRGSCGRAYVYVCNNQLYKRLKNKGDTDVKIRPQFFVIPVTNTQRQNRNLPGVGNQSVGQSVSQSVILFSSDPWIHIDVREYGSVLFHGVSDVAVEVVVAARQPAALGERHGRDAADDVVRVHADLLVGSDVEQHARRVVGSGREREPARKELSSSSSSSSSSSVLFTQYKASKTNTIVPRCNFVTLSWTAKR